MQDLPKSSSWVKFDTQLGSVRILGSLWFLDAIYSIG
jgi:hypothetical protein